MSCAELLTLGARLGGRCIARHGATRSAWPACSPHGNRRNTGGGRRLKAETQEALEAVIGHWESDLYQSHLPKQLLARFAAVNQLYGTVAGECDSWFAERLTTAVDFRRTEMRALGEAYGTFADTPGDGGDWVGSLSTSIDRGPGLARTLARAEQLLQEMLDRAISATARGHPAHGQLLRSREASVRWRNDLVLLGLKADPTMTLSQIVDDVYRPRRHPRFPHRRAAR